jgi:N-acetylmuramic acid 6-phosphate etherase
MRNEKTMHIDRATTSEMISLLHNENYNAVRAIDGALPEIERAVDMITERIAEGGRLIYMGAGTSGRLGVIDAAECPPTYGVPADTIVGIIAGGMDRMHSASEGAEDSGECGIADLKAKRLTKLDTVMGISAAGNAAYVADALAYARSLGILTIGLTCNSDSRLATETDVAIVTDTGAEAITGSTRMKAGTAHKMVLTMLSTAIMIKLGHVYENMMINVKPSNIKLRRRVISIVREILLCDEERAVELLEATEWSIRRAVDANKK